MQGVTSAETIAAVLGGVVVWAVVFLVKFFGLNIQNRIALWFAYVVSILVAVFVYIVTGGPVTPEGLVVGGGAIMGYSQIVWRQFDKGRKGENPLTQPDG